MRPSVRLAAALLIALPLAACVSRQAATDIDTREKDAPSVEPPVASAPVTSTWSAETLGDLLVGEVAGQRGQLDVALEHYLRQARAQRSAELAARATRIAWYARQPEAARDAATLWAELAPQDPEANAYAVMGLIQAGQIEEAEPLIDRQLADDSRQARFSYLVGYARESAPDVRQRVGALLANLSERHPRQSRLWLARATLAELDGKVPEALDFARRAGELDANYPDAFETQGRLLLANGESDAARKLLRGAAKRFPRERDLRLTYLRALRDTGRHDETRRELVDMARIWPEDGDLALTLAVLEWESGDADAARLRMVEIAEAGYREDEAWTYAGQIALGQRRYEEAATYFQNVRGPAFLQAQVQVAYAWQKLGRLEDARRLVQNLRQQAPESATMLFVAESELLWRGKQADESYAVLESALAANPADRDLRYARAMAAERLGRIDVVEADLRLLLAETPQNAMLLNALGYTLADRTTRYAEAQQLIEQAAALSPDDPAIIDSMGWVLYRLGRIDEAIPWLRRAYGLSPDGEIAAHLGEVLWVSGKQREARDLWKRALVRDPEHAILKRTVERFAP